MTENTTSQYTPYYTGTQPPAPKKPSFFRRHWLIITVGVVALALGSGIGSANTPEPKTVEVIKEVPGPERIKTVEKKVEVPTTPAVCLQALTLTEEAFDIASAAVGAISSRDIAALNGYTADLKKLTPSVNAAKSACRAS